MLVGMTALSGSRDMPLISYLFRSGVPAARPYTHCDAVVGLCAVHSGKPDCSIAPIALQTWRLG